MSDFLLIGLGNPGPRYAATRHNVGFMAVDRIGDLHQIALTQQKFHGRYNTGRIGDASVVLLQPDTFMNLSGKSVAAAVKFYQLEAEQLIVFHDEIDLEPGVTRVKIGGGHGGHNGLRDIVDKLGTRDFTRVRIGVGRPEHGDVTSWVLGAFRQDQLDPLDDQLEVVAKVAEKIVKDGPEAAQNEFNGTGPSG